jgi:hypothetical protein
MHVKCADGKLAIFATASQVKQALKLSGHSEAKEICNSTTLTVPSIALSLKADT